MHKTINRADIERAVHAQLKTDHQIAAQQKAEADKKTATPPSPLPACPACGRGEGWGEGASDISYTSTQYETRITNNGHTGRIKILPANPRTARGFSGDLILDEFAHHENAAEIWDAVEPILASNPGYHCRIASTPNGPNNTFHQLIHSARYPVRRITRADAWERGLHIPHPVTREPITPEQARELALDKHTYDQNYNCDFTVRAATLLTDQLIARAQTPDTGILCTGQWSEAALHNIANSPTPIYIGVDVGRHHDLTVITVLTRSTSCRRRGDEALITTVGAPLEIPLSNSVNSVNSVSTPTYQVIALLRLHNTRLPDQQRHLLTITKHKQFHTACIDTTGLGLGLCEHLQQHTGIRKTRGINFATTIPINPRLHPHQHPRPGEHVRITEHLALQLLRAYENHQIFHPLDNQMRDDLLAPARITTPGGHLSIAATDTTTTGHADHFWSLALALHAATLR